MTSASRVNNFQAVRWFAASLVVASHIYLEASRVGIKVASLSSAANFADFGVAIFFVLSGWLMSGQMMRRDNSMRNYLWRRLVRILPLYALVTLGVICYQTFISHNIEPTHWALSLLFLSQAFGYGHPVLYVGWTLEFEMFFYLLVGATLLLKGVKSRITIAAGTLVLLASLGVLPPVVVYFAWGILGYLVQKSKLTIPKPSAGVLAIFLSILLMCQIALGAKVYGSVAILGLELAIFFYALAQTWQIKSKFVELLGDSSYAQYLVHVPVLTVLVSIFAIRVDSTSLIFICFIAVNALAVATWLLIDKPIGKFGRALSFKA